MAALDDQRRAAGLKPLPPKTDGKAEEPKKKERGHGRGTTTYHVVGGSPELRGVPLIGTGPGGLENTRPGGELGRVEKLEAEIRELAGSRTARGGAAFIVKQRTSKSGVLRASRAIV